MSWRSDIGKTILIYRAYNSCAKTGARNFTSSIPGQRQIVDLGWHDEGIVWHGIKQTVKS